MPKINWLRIIRLVLGISFIGEAIADKQWLFLLPGFILTYQSIINVGCSTCEEEVCETNFSNDKTQF